MRARMEPEAALIENKENFAIDLSTVKNAKINRRDRQGQGRNTPLVHYLEVMIDTPGGNKKFEFENDNDSSEPIFRAFGTQ